MIRTISAGHWLVIAVCIAFQYSWSRSSQESLESILEEFLHTTWPMISHQGASHLFGALQTHQQRTYLECILIIYHLETFKEFVVLDCVTQRFPSNCTCSWYWLKFLPDSLQGQLSGNVCNKYCQPLVKRKPSVRNSLKNPSPLILAGEDTLPAPPGKARNTKRSLSQRETMKEGYRKTTSGSNSYRQTTSEYMRQIAT